MKNKKMVVVMILALVAVFVIAACTTPNTVVEEPANNTETATQETVVEATTTDMSDADMEALILEKLNGNHAIDRVLNADKTREEWGVTLDRMIGYGAKITPEEKELIIEWLLNR